MTRYFGQLPVKTIGEVFGTAPAAPAVDNPFKRDANGSIRSPGAISAAIKRNPEHARALCRQAGEPLAAWFPNNPR